MIGAATMKRTVKQTAGWAAVVSSLFAKPAMEQGCIFYYHRVADVGFIDRQTDDWNVTPDQFEKQIRTLVTFADVVPLNDLSRRLSEIVPGARPLVSLTFDDGYANFHSQVLPVLKRYQLPATAFVVTSSIGTAQPMHFDHWARKHSGRTSADAWRPLNWNEIENCVSTGLVTLGAHSHRHLRGSRCTPDEIFDETSQAREILRSRLGEAHSLQYAYPYGNSKLGDVSRDYKAIVENAGYQLAVTTDLGLVDTQRDPYLLPRLEAHMLDSPGVMKAKALGALAPYRFTDHFRGAYRVS